MEHVKTPRKIRIYIGIVMLILFVSFPFLNDMKQFIMIPEKIVTFADQQAIQLPTPSSLLTLEENEQVDLDENKLSPQSKGSSQLVYTAADVPVKKVDVEVLKDTKVIPGGQSVGVKLQTTGALVVGHHLINKDKKKEDSPAEEANIQVGDVIVEMNGSNIKQMKDVKPIIKKAGKNNKPIHVKLKRGKEVIDTNINPILDKRNKTYQIGLYIRDAAAGIGTISFYEEDTGKYGALGHTISDANTKKPLEINNGKIVNSTVTSIEKGNEGIPGEKQAKFSMDDQSLGNITKNTPFGIYGKLKPENLVENNQKPLPVALPGEVKEGPAQILTVLEGDEVQKFDIEIVNSVRQNHPGTKGMVIKVTDKQLLEKTGGIVQGMSGSPIIQDGKLAGAVTHVFVNDPTSGYGVHVQWMLEEADILEKETSEQKAS